MTSNRSPAVWFELAIAPTVPTIDDVPPLLGAIVGTEGAVPDGGNRSSDRVMTLGSGAPGLAGVAPVGPDGLPADAKYSVMPINGMLMASSWKKLAAVWRSLPSAS
jgi:hypothetical protein